MTDPLDRARALVELDRGAEARAVLSGVIAQDPGNPTALCLLAQACLSQGDLPAAGSAARAAVQAEPEGEWPLRLAALTTARLNRVDEARSYADAAVRVDPNGWRAALARAQVDVIAGRVTDATMAAARRAVQLAPAEAGTHLTYGNALLAQGARREAEAAIREALRLDPTNAAARNDLARVHLRRRRDFGRAAAGFAAAAALNPGDDVAARNLVVVGAKSLRVVHLVMWVVLVGVSTVSAHTSGGRRALAGAGFGVAAVALAGFGVTLWLGTRPRTGRLLRIVFERDRLLTVWFGCLAGALLLLGVAGLLPGSAVDPLIGASFGALFVGVVVSWVRGARHRRANSAPRRRG